MAKAVFVLLNNGAGALRGDDGDAILARIEHALAGQAATSRLQGLRAANFNAASMTGSPAAHLRR
jgi:hypothetical protein